MSNLRRIAEKSHKKKDEIEEQKKKPKEREKRKPPINYKIKIES